VPFCIFGEQLLDEKTKPEHILHDALGGRKTTRRVICSDCNNTFGDSIDRALTGPFEVIRNLFQMRSGYGSTAPTLADLQEAINLVGATAHSAYLENARGAATLFISATGLVGGPPEIRTFHRNIALDTRSGSDQQAKKPRHLLTIDTLT
jgi:hypothetical protein